MKVKIQVDESDAIISVHRKEDDSIVGSIEELKAHKPLVVTITPAMYVLVTTDDEAPAHQPAA